MTTIPGPYRISSSGDLISLEKEMGRGGEGVVYRSSSHPSFAVKILNEGDKRDQTLAKVREMLKKRPRKTQIDNHTIIAWPVDTLQDGQGKAIGYMMPCIQDALLLYNVYHPAERRRDPRTQNFTYLDLAYVALSLARTVKTIHDEALIIGDLNDHNVLVAGKTATSLIDVDSFQFVTEMGKLFPCTVGRPEYVAPELIRQKLNTLPRRYTASDLFSLGVLLYQILMEGQHPYAGIDLAATGAGNLVTRIEQGLFVGAKTRHVAAQLPHASPPRSVLGPDIEAMFHRCFDEGHNDPDKRPSAKEWCRVLAAWIKQLTACSQDKVHFFDLRQAACPWCTRPRRGHPTPVPPKVIPTPVPPRVTPTPSTSTTPPQTVPMMPQVVQAQTQPIVSPPQTPISPIRPPPPRPVKSNAAKYVAAVGVIATLGTGYVYISQDKPREDRRDEGASCDYGSQCKDGLTCRSGRCAKPDNGSSGLTTPVDPALKPTSLPAPSSTRNDSPRQVTTPVVLPQATSTAENTEPSPPSTNDDKPLPSFELPSPKSTSTPISRPRTCPPPKVWDEQPRGWAKKGPNQYCLPVTSKKGYYLRVATDMDRQSSKLAIANAWQRYVALYLDGAPCPQAEEIVFISAYVGAGIFFPAKPPHWDELVEKESDWMLRDNEKNMVTEPVCFFLTPERTLPSSW